MLLGENPLLDINATRTVERVMLFGQMLDLQELKRSASAPSTLPLERIEEEVCSPHHLRSGLAKENRAH